MLTPETLQQHITRHDKRLLEMAYGNSVAAASDRAGEIRGLLQVLLEVKTAWEHDRQRIEELERAIKRALSDEETGYWGPDVTVAKMLRAALAGRQSDADLTLPRT